jgi:flagellar biosynthesis/type III secretory pathway M-ring protein FliF/YscJ
MKVDVQDLLGLVNLLVSILVALIGVSIGWFSHALRIERQKERAEKEEDRRRRADGLVAEEAWIWAQTKYPTSQRERSAACEGYNAGAKGLKGERE